VHNRDGAYAERVGVADAEGPHRPSVASERVIEMSPKHSSAVAQVDRERDHAVE
jgi:hypothetical protein